MRALVIHPGPAFAVADVHDGIVKGLRANGVDVMSFNLDDRLTFYEGAYMKQDDGTYLQAFGPGEAIMLAAKGIETVCYEWWPDLVVIVSGFFIPPEVLACLARRPHHKVLWCTESPYEDIQQAQPAALVDTVILNDPLNLHNMQQVNPRTFYLPHSYDPDRHYPAATNDKRHDFVFVGTGFASRIDFLEQVDWSGITATLAGNWQQLGPDSPLRHMVAHSRDVCIGNDEAARLYRVSRISANLYRKEHHDGNSPDGWAMGPREVELAACGAFFLREPRAEGDALLPFLPTFTTPDEFSDALRWWLAHPDERESAAARARAAIAPRTFTNTAATLLRLVDGAPTTLH